MVVSQDLADDIRRLVILETGYQAEITTITPIDHPVYGQTVFRAIFDRDVGPSGTSAIVKRRREAGTWRSEISLSHNEIAALQFLSGQGVTVAPQVIASDDTAGIIVMEDLGSGPSLADMLFNHDSRAATAALVAFGTALGEMHAATAGADGEYYRHRRACPVCVSARLATYFTRRSYGYRYALTELRLEFEILRAEAADD